MKKSKIVSILLIPIISLGITMQVQAKGFSGGHSSSHSISHSSFHSSSHSRSFKSISHSNRIRSNSFKIKSSTGFKNRGYRINKTKITNKNVKINKNVNINKNINKTIIHKHYHAPNYHTTYRTPYGHSFKSSFWDNYWLYRAVTHHNTVIVNNNGTTETVNYGYSGIWKDKIGRAHV